MTFGDATFDSLNMNLFKKILKIILAVIVGIFILDVGLWAGSRMMKGYLMWKGERLVSQFKADSERPLREDVYGGKTPEETFDMYLAALKKGDLELASKYFVVERQGEESEYLKSRTSGQLADYVKKIDGLSSIWKIDQAGSGEFSKIYFSSERNVEIQFNYNQLTKIWKIKFL